MSGKRGDFHPPAGFREVAETLESRGYEAWAVGGAVRDELLGHSRADWDLATDARPADLRRIFRRTVPIGIEHGTVGVVASDGIMYEVTTFRRDVETDGRHAVIEFADSIDEDLARRDFTINALAWRPMTDELRDPYGGVADLESGVLRAVGDPTRRFAEDYLRVLRGLRFAGRFELEIEPETGEALSAGVRRLGGLSAERVREELMKVLSGPRPAASLRLYGEHGALDLWYPEVAEASRADPAFELSLAAVEELPAHRPLLRLVRWWLPIGSDAEDRVERTRALTRRLKFSNADASRILHLMRHYEPPVSPTDSAAQIRCWLSEVGVSAARDLFRLRFAGARARRAIETMRLLAFTWRRVHQEQLGHPPLGLGELAIDGSDLLELGVDEGPAIGVLLDELHARVLEDPSVNEREILLEMARELMEIGHLGAGGRRRDG